MRCDAWYLESCIQGVVRSLRIFVQALIPLHNHHLAYLCCLCDSFVSSHPHFTCMTSAAVFCIAASHLRPRPLLAQGVVGSSAQLTSSSNAQSISSSSAQSRGRHNFAPIARQPVALYVVSCEAPGDRGRHSTLSHFRAGTPSTSSPL